MNKILNIAIGVLLLSLAVWGGTAVIGGSSAPAVAGLPDAGGAQASGRTWHAVWYYTPQSVQEAYQLSTVAVLATVTQIEQTPDLVVLAQGEPEGVDRVPNQTITLAVNETFKGVGSKTIQVFHTGDAVRWADGDPAYAVGEQYVLFLLPREDGRYVLVAPEGRYAVANSAV